MLRLPLILQHRLLGFFSVFVQYGFRLFYHTSVKPVMPPPKDSPFPNFLALDSDYYTETVHSDTYAAISPLRANLSGKAVFITGASRGLGQAIAISYAQAGASQIALGARNVSPAVEEAVLAAAAQAKRPPPTVLRVNCDVTSRESVENAAREVGSAFGHVDIVINNAGVLGMGPVAEGDPDEWWNIMTVNLRGPYLVARSFLPLLSKSKTQVKYMVNVASCGTHLVIAGASAYQTSKCALARLTEFIQKENVDHGIVAFSTHPGNMKTDMVGDVDQISEHAKHSELISVSCFPLFPIKLATRFVRIA